LQLIKIKAWREKKQLQIVPHPINKFSPSFFFPIHSPSNSNEFFCIWKNDGNDGRQTAPVRTAHPVRLIHWHWHWPTATTTTTIRFIPNWGRNFIRSCNHDSGNINDILLSLQSE
jgi:hypothetical protein